MAGGKSTLTPEAKIMVKRFKELQKRIEHEAYKIFTEIYQNEDR